MNYKVIKSYALDLRPHELNILWEIPGEDIFLYDSNYIEKNKRRENGRIMYDFAGQNSRYALKYFVKKFLAKHAMRKDV